MTDLRFNSRTTRPIHERASHPFWSLLAAATLLLAALPLVACSASHLRGGTSTETGNPPAIDSSLVAQITTKGTVHITGEPGAVSPGSIEVEVTNLATGKKQKANVANDGSFDIAVSGSSSDAYEISAVDGSGRSEPVYLILEVATVGEGKNGALSCEQRGDITSQLIDAVDKGADRNCTSDADCVYGQAHAVCGPLCSSPVVSRTQQAQVDSAILKISDAVCGSPGQYGCPVAFVDCATPAPLLCVDGECRATSTPPSCDDRIRLAGTKIADAANRADRTCTTAADCTLAPTGASCHAACSDAVVSQAGKAELASAIDAIDVDVCGAFEAEGCQLIVPPCDPPSMAPLACVAGECQQAGECPPNAKFLPDLCRACGPAGGCLNGGEAGCAIVCGGSDAACAGVGDGSYACGTRGVCEVLGCD